MPEDYKSDSFINILLRVKNNHLHFSIQNNINPDYNLMESIEMENFQRRLSLSYPDSHTFNLETSSNLHKATLDIQINDPI